MYKQHPEKCKTNMTEETLGKYQELSYEKKQFKKPFEIYIETLGKIKPDDLETSRTLIVKWMEINPETRPPLFKTLLWYAYQAKYITQSQFISEYYTESKWGFGHIGQYPTYDPLKSDLINSLDNYTN